MTPEIDINVTPIIIVAVVIIVLFLVALAVGIYFLVKALSKDTSGASRMRIVCRQCGSVIEEGVRFCAACGGDASNSFAQNPSNDTTAKKICMGCGSEISGGAKFCKFCGKEQ